MATKKPASKQLKLPPVDEQGRVIVSLLGETLTLYPHDAEDFRSAFVPDEFRKKYPARSGTYPQIQGFTYCLHWLAGTKPPMWELWMDPWHYNADMGAGTTYIQCESAQEACDQITLKMTKQSMRKLLKLLPYQPKSEAVQAEIRKWIDGESATVVLM